MTTAKSVNSSSSQTVFGYRQLYKRKGAKRVEGQGAGKSWNQPYFERMAKSVHISIQYTISKALDIPHNLQFGGSCERNGLVCLISP